MSIIWQLIVGLIIGAIARLLIPGKTPVADGAIMSWLITALIGMAGSLIGTLIGKAIWRDNNYAAGWIMSIVCAVLLLFLYLKFI